MYTDEEKCEMPIGGQPCGRTEDVSSRVVVMWPDGKGAYHRGNDDIALRVCWECAQNAYDYLNDAFGVDVVRIIGVDFHVMYDEDEFAEQTSELARLGVYGKVV